MTDWEGLKGELNKMRTGAGLKVLVASVRKMSFFRDTDGTRAKGGSAKCSSEISFIHKGTPLLSPLLYISQNFIMARFAAFERY